MTSSAVVGWYGAAGRLFDTLSFLPNIVMIVLFPVSSKLSLSSDEGLKRAVEKSVNFLLFCGIPIATGMIVAAPNIVKVLYHRAEFTHTIPALMAFAPGVVFLYINTALNVLMLSKKQERKLPIMAGAALVLNVGLNLLFIPLYRHIGAAIVTSLTEALLCCLAIAFIPRYLRPVASLRVGVKTILASLVMALAILPLRAHSIVAILPIATMVYVGVGMLVGAVPIEDIKAVYRAIRHKGDEGAAPEPWTPPDVILARATAAESVLPSTTTTEDAV
jgi:O-antigen/teichoic acid export membrane protein